MSKGLEALKNIKREKPTFFSAIYDCDMWKEDTETIEKELKALEIIRNKFVNLTVFRMTAFMKKEGADCYNWYFSSEEMHLTSEEFDLLKEVLG